MSQEERQQPSEMNGTVISDPSTLLANSAVTEHTIRVDPDDESLVMKVRVRELSFMDMQSAIKTFVAISTDGGVEIDIAGYWKYMFDKCVVSTDPTIGRGQLNALNQFVGSQLSAILPQPQDLLAGPLEIGNEE